MGEVLIPNNKKPTFLYKKKILITSEFLKRFFEFNEKVKGPMRKAIRNSIEYQNIRISDKVSEKPLLC